MGWQNNIPFFATAKLTQSGLVKVLSNTDWIWATLLNSMAKSTSQYSGLQKLGRRSVKVGENHPEGGDEDGSAATTAHGGVQGPSRPGGNRGNRTLNELASAYG